MNTFDRRRVALASVFTMLALPALWVFNRSDSSRSTAPSVAAAGVDAGRVGSDTAPVDTYEPEVPVFLGNKPAPADPAVVNVVVPALDTGNQAEAKASYRRYPDATTSPCTTLLVPFNTMLTVTNLDNGQSVQCLNSFGTALPAGVDLVIHTDLFVKISDLADAPAPVRITW
jgi:hypothetical protein